MVCIGKEDISSRAGKQYDFVHINRERKIQWFVLEGVISLFSLRVGKWYDFFHTNRLLVKRFLVFQKLIDAFFFSDQVLALFSYTAQNEDELTFYKGSVINVIKKEGDWWKGELNGQVGMFPFNYVQILTDLPDNSGQCK